MGYRWKPNANQKRAYIAKMKEREILPIIYPSKAIRNGCFVSFYSKYHGKIIEGSVVNNSYGTSHFIGQNDYTGEQLYSKGQHTFTIQDNKSKKYRVKGRNLYDSLLNHIPGEESLKIN